MMRGLTTLAHAMSRIIGLLMLGAAASAQAGPELQSRADAWWTGPLLAPSGATLPQGHWLIEPYLFDVMTGGHIDQSGTHHDGPREHDLGSLTYILYGFTDRFTGGIIPRFAYNEPAGAPNSSGVGVGDFTLQAGYGLTQYQDGHLTPAIALVLQETLPTGSYDRLTHPSDGFGSGAYQTAFNVFSQDYFWLPNGRILRARLDLTYTISSSVQLRDQSVYGTPAGFRGSAYPGDGVTVDLAGEYSVTRNWVLAMDVVYQHAQSTRVSGSVNGIPGTYPQESGSSYSVAFAPAVEYNFSSRIGVIFGVRIIEIGRNTSTSVTPAIALNMVF